MNPTELKLLMVDYCRELEDLPIEAFIFAVRAALNDDKEWYAFPTIGQLRGYANKYLSHGILSAAQAWRACLEGTAPSDSLAAQIFENLGYNRYDLPFMSHEHVGIRQNAFMKAYREALADRNAAAKLPAALRKTLPRAELIALDSPNPPPPADEAPALSPEEAKARLRDIYAQIEETKLKHDAEQQDMSNGELIHKRKQQLKRQLDHILNESA